MSALDIAKEWGRDAVLQKIKEAGLCEFGLQAEPLADRIERAAAMEVEAGLNNADTDKALLNLLKEDPDKVFDGINTAAYLTGAQKQVLYLPETETELAESLKAAAEKYGVQIAGDIIDVREAEDTNALLLHIVTAADLADLMNGCYTGMKYISLDGETLQKAEADKKISEIVDLSGVKGVKAGYHFYTPEEAKELTAADALTGYIKVLTEKNCMVQEALGQISAYRKASCGKCVFCREGLIQLEYMQKEITSARGKMDYAALTEEIGTAMCTNTLCSIGHESAKAALDAFGKYADEYTDHIKKNKCPAGACNSFVRIYIDPQTCTGCEECTDVCPADCIEGKAKYIHMIDEFDCTKCGKCIEACEEDAIIQTAGKLPKLPNKLTKVGKFKKR